MVLKQMGASVCVWEVHNDQEKSDTKSETQLRGAQLQLASRKQGTYWKDSGDLGHRNQSRSKDLNDWTQEIRRHQFSLSCSRSFPSLFFDCLSLTTFFPKASTPSERVQSYLPYGFISWNHLTHKERSSETSWFKGVFWMAHLRSHIQLETNHPGSVMESYEWLYMVVWPWPSSTHDCQFPAEPHDWSLVVVAPKIVAGGWSRA